MGTAESVVAVGHPSTSFEDFVAAHGHSLGGFAVMITGSHADAQDVVQEALVGAYPRWGRIVAAGDPLAYVRRSIINRHISARRKLRRLVSWEDRHARVSDPMSAVDDRDWALRMIATLPDRQRVAVVLRVMEGREFADIADTLGVTEANARKLASRGIAALRSRLTKEVPDA